MNVLVWLTESSSLCVLSIVILMPIKFFLMVNKQGQTRLAQYLPLQYRPFSVCRFTCSVHMCVRYYDWLTIEERGALEGEIVRKCLGRSENQCSFIEYRNYKCVYRRYASLFFIVGVDSDQNELSILEFIHAVVETLDKYFENVVCLCAVCFGPSESSTLTHNRVAVCMCACVTECKVWIGCKPPNSLIPTLVSCVSRVMMWRDVWMIDCFDR